MERGVDPEDVGGITLQSRDCCISAKFIDHVQAHNYLRYQTEVWPLPLSPRDPNVEALGGGVVASGLGIETDPGRESGIGVGSTYSSEGSVSCDTVAVFWRSIVYKEFLGAVNRSDV